MKRSIKKFLRVEFFLPLVYLIFAAGILLYQRFTPDVGIRIRKTDWLFVYLSIPSIPVGYLVDFLFGEENLKKGQRLDYLMIWLELGSSSLLNNISITWQFIVTPVCYYVYGLCLRKSIEYYKRLAKENYTHL